MQRVAIVQDITEHKRAEEAVRASEERFRRLVEVSSQIVWVTNANGEPVEDSPSWRAYTGRTLEQWLGMNWLDVIHPEDRRRVADAWNMAVSTVSPHKIEFRQIHRSGEYRHIECRAVPILNSDGSVREWVGMNMDITERKQSEEAVRESREDLNRAQAVAHTGSWRLDVGRNKLTWSDETYRIFGIPEGTPLTYETFLSFVHPEDREYVDRKWSTAMRGKPYQIEHRIIAGDTVKWVGERVELEFDNEGALLGGFGTVQDITVRKLAESNRVLLADTLRILNRGGDFHSLVAETLRLIRDATGFDAVGLRLRRGEDCPYFEQDGFSEEFLREENFLCKKGLYGTIVRDTEGRAVLECTCGVVLSGRTDPSMDCFTEGGSFWTNHSHELLALAPEADPRTNPRNRCIHAGYESVGLFPVRSGKEIIGLLQLNGRRASRFTPRLVAFYETLAQNIGLALQRTMAEKALRESEEKYRSLYDEAPVGYVELDHEGRIERVNKKILKMLGYDAGEMLGQHMWDFVVERRDAEATIKAKLSGRENLSEALERTYRRKDGTPIPVLIKDRFVKDKEGRIMRVRGIIQDITELKRATEALQQSEERYRWISENAADVIWVMDAASQCFKYVSPSVQKLRGYTPDEIMAQPISDALTPESAKRVTELLAVRVPQFLSGDPMPAYFMDEVDQPCKDGSIVHTEVTTRFLLNKQDQIEIIGVTRDITERKKTEETLRTHEAQLAKVNQIMSGILEHTHMLAALLDSQFNFVWANRAYSAASGHDSSFFPGKNHFDLYPHEENKQIFQRVVNTGEPLFIIAKPFGYPDQPERGVTYWDWSLIPVKDDAGKVSNLVFTLMEVTERIRAQEELRKAHAQLELRVKERTTELENKNRELQDFAFIASHDLSEPLRKIQTFGSILEAKCGDRIDEQEKDYITRMTSAANRMKNLLEALLRYSRVETRKEEFRSVRLNDIVNDTISDLEIALRNAGAQVEIGPLPVIKGDPYQWRQVFQNLIANAVKYQRSEVKTVIKIYGLEGTGRVFVEDNGIGFDEQYLDKIFLPFQRLHGKHEYSGTGIGLAICRKVVERHGGKITAKSTPGKGSTFIITLPEDAIKATKKPE